MRPIERRLGEVAEVMAGMTGLGDVGNYRYGVVQPNSFPIQALLVPLNGKSGMTRFPKSRN